MTSAQSWIPVRLCLSRRRSATTARTPTDHARMPRCTPPASATLPIGRIIADEPHHSGKHQKHGMNVRVVADAQGRLLWTSPVLPAAVHDVWAARERGIVDVLAEVASSAGRTRVTKVPTARSAFPTKAVETAFP